MEMMTRRSFSFVILLTLCAIDLKNKVLGQEYQIMRSQQGDFLYGQDIDCSLHNGVRVDANRCFCQVRSSYYTNSDNVTGCFNGPATEQLGK